MTRRRFRLSGGKKLALIVVGLLIAWQFMKLPEMIDAFLTFCLAGVVPGTNVVLSPEAVMRFAGITIGIIIILLALRPILRNLFGKKKQHDEPMPLNVEQPVSNSADGIIEHPVDEPAITPAQAFREQTFVTQDTESLTAEVAEEIAQQNTAPTWFSVLADKVYALLEKVMPRLLASLVKAGVLAQPKLKRVQEEVAKASALVKRRAVKDFWWAIAHAKAFWRWLVPYLWQFDGWLEIKVRAIEDRVKHKVKHHDTAGTVVDLSKHAKRAVSEMDVQTKVKKVTTKVKPYAHKATASAKKAKVSAKKATSKAKSAAAKARKTTTKQK